MNEPQLVKQTISFSDFLLATGNEHEEFVNSLHNCLENLNCIYKIKTGEKIPRNYFGRI